MGHFHPFSIAFFMFTRPGHHQTTNRWWCQGRSTGEHPASKPAKHSVSASKASPKCRKAPKAWKNGEKLQETHGFLPSNEWAFRLKLSHHPILWVLGKSRVGISCRKSRYELLRWFYAGKMCWESRKYMRNIMGFSGILWWFWLPKYKESESVGATFNEVLKNGCPSP